MAKKPDKKDKKKVAAAKKKPAPKAVKKAAPKKQAKPAPKKAAPPAKKAAAAPKGKAAAAAVGKKAAAPAPAKKAAAAPAPAKAAKAPKAAPIPPKVAEKAAKAKKEEVNAKTVPVEDVVEAEEIQEEEPVEEVVLTDAEGRRYCRVKDCDQVSTVDGYCRFHYLLYWKKIQIRKKILSEGKLERYVEDLTARYPDKFLDMLRKDLKSEKEFLAAIQELEIDESAVDNEFEEETQTYIDEVRGMGEPTSTREEEDF